MNLKLMTETELSQRSDAHPMKTGKCQGKGGHCMEFWSALIHKETEKENLASDLRTNSEGEKETQIKCYGQKEGLVIEIKCCKKAKNNKD